MPSDLVPCCRSKFLFPKISKLLGHPGIRNGGGGDLRSPATRSQFAFRVFIARKLAAAEKYWMDLQ